ncbi:MAG TPA: O-antigen ligase family protein [Phycisphaerae bacterium]|jgi:O-antigen ligase
MSFRIAILSLIVLAVAVYAWRDWFKALCGLIVMMAFIEHPDMPKSLFGLQGLNPWNLLMCNILLAWWMGRQREGLAWDLPRHINLMLLIYLGVVIVGFVRMMADRAYMDGLTTEYLISEHLINSIKWVVPGLLLYDGCRTRKRVLTGMISILAVYLLLAVQVTRWMPASTAVSGASLTSRARKLLMNEVGYSSVNMSMMLAGASWAVLATLPLVKRRKYKVLIVLAGVGVAFAQALTGGRMGYVTWGAVGLILCLVRWRKYLLLAPLVPIFVMVVLPGTAERMLQGFGRAAVTGKMVIDDYEVTSGRSLIWPYVIDKIMESPIVGYGRQAMLRTGLQDRLWRELGESFPHPHNAYLEMLLDNGLIGFMLVLPFYGLVVVYSMRLFVNRHSALYSAVGGVSLALVLALLVASIGSQTFYPREGAVGMWGAFCLMFRTSVARERRRAALPRQPREPAAAEPLPQFAGAVVPV